MTEYPDVKNFQKAREVRHPSYALRGRGKKKGYQGGTKMEETEELNRVTLESGVNVAGLDKKGGRKIGLRDSGHGT